VRSDKCKVTESVQFALCTCHFALTLSPSRPVIPMPAALLNWLLLAVVLAVVLLAAWKVLRPKRKLFLQVPDLAIDVMALPTESPPADAPKLSYYGVSVRLAALVLAPAGRVRELPPLNHLGDVIDAIFPGLAQVVAAHRTLVRRWPMQVSVKGFAHQFFTHAKLPGQSGRGSPWSSAAGVFKIEGQPLMAGMIFRAAAPTHLQQSVIEREAKWFDVLRIQ
jgi:hypothetical protein